MTLDITVTDVNDHDPEWTQFIPAVSVRENEKVGTSVVDLRATDMDEGLNGEIEYSIALGTNGTSLFDVKKFDDRAELRVAMSLIGSSGSQLVTVVATDKGSPRRSASVDVMVTVVDMNLHRPVFIHPDESVYNVTSRFLPKVTVPEVTVQVYWSLEITPTG
ncbi:protocadherin alpha-11-like [Aplysia californica]|uniref:Protocadherin alpha-11-like n=1 Tax=Aplysia californica TaxID=6500 RepID=A0ABM1VQ13_APLCA|nr:protocadherin alpha-11-like [Aplysia californica]